MRWQSSPINDAIADSLVGMIMTLQTKVTGAVAKILEEEKKAKKPEKDWLDFFLREHFGDDLKHDAESNVYSLTHSSGTATIKVSSKKHQRPTVKIAASSPALQNKLELLISCIDTAIYPLPRVQKGKR